MTAADVRFAFGENWASFSDEVTNDRIERAVESMKRLFPNNELVGKAFLDIGCGSGLSMIAALRLGAASVHGIDLDINSVETSRKLLTAYAPNQQWTVAHRSVFDLKPDEKFPVVHSWGVLHHTGEMHRAITTAAKVVAPGGLLAIAIYTKTPLCGAWRHIKRAYNKMPSLGQKAMRSAYKGAFLSALVATGRSPLAYVANYHKERGMNWTHDVHDWMGGYPYESASADEISDFLLRLNFKVERSIIQAVRARGIFGSGCSEFVARRIPK